MQTKSLVSEANAEFLESGLSITVACRDADLEPEGGLAWAASVHEEADRLTLYLYEAAGRDLLKHLESQPAIAILFDQPMTHRACQVKGTFLSSRPARADERAEVERQVEGFILQLEGIGIPRAMCAGWLTWPCLAFDVRIEQLFEQTPGPGTGGPLKP